MKRLMFPLMFLCLLASMTLSWAQSKSKVDSSTTGRSMDIRAYCRKIYGDSADVSHVRSIGNSWHCTVGKREYPVDMNDVCRLQYGESFCAKLANPADSYTWSCNSSKALPK
jgi:hypothetical protein